MSVVYRAEQVRLGRIVALKLLAEALTHDPSFRERFERESRHAAEIDHPNIIPIYDAGEAEGQLFIAMKYVRGTDLRTIIEREGALGVGRTLLYLQQAASALGAAHDRNLIHRDVKPANILVEQPSERVYLSDFGIVKHTASPGMTRTGVFVGTVDYASPEQIEGLTVDVRADVYALGCVLFECLAGRAPFGRDSEVAVMHAHLSEAPPSLHELRPDLPRSLDRVIGVAMAKSADDRYDSCEELMSAVQTAAEERSTTASRTSRRPANDGGRESATAVVPPTIVDKPKKAARPPREPRPPRERGSGGGVPGWVPVVGAMVIGALIAVIVALFVTRDNGSGGAKTVVLTETGGGITTTTTTTTPTGTGTTTLAIDPTKTQIGKVVPQTILKDCKLADTATNGAMETANCVPPSSAGSTFYPTSWTLSVYPSSQAMLTAYNQLLTSHKLTDNKGSCNGVSWGGAGPWLHGPGKPGGHRLCYFQGGHAVIVWTHEKLGQADHIDFLGIAQADDLDHPELFSWWRFWHHRMGKLLPGDPRARRPGRPRPRRAARRRLRCARAARRRGRCRHRRLAARRRRPAAARAAGRPARREPRRAARARRIPTARTARPAAPARPAGARAAAAGSGTSAPSSSSEVAGSRSVGGSSCAAQRHVDADAEQHRRPVDQLGRIPASFRPETTTSFGQRSRGSIPVVRTASQAAIPPTSERAPSSSARRFGRSRIEVSSEVP